MKNKRLLSPKEAAFELGISIKTVHRWDEAGKLHTVRTAGNQRRIPIEEISRLRRQGEGKQGAERCVLYARVASARQAEDGNLARQRERLISAHELLTWAEACTVATTAHPSPWTDWNFSERFAGMPFARARVR